MTRTMYDSTQVDAIPRTAKMVAGYVDGRFRTVEGLHRRFPKARVVTITVLGTPGAHVCDTEPGNISIPHAVQWAVGEVHAGRHPTLYCMASVWDDVKAEVHARGLTGKVSYWIAQYDGDKTIPAGAVAKQYADPDITRRHYDVSAVADHWPGVDPVGRAALTKLSIQLARHLTRRLRARKAPVGRGRAALIVLGREIDRVLKIKGEQ